jgi:hypothetical protein
MARNAKTNADAPVATGTPDPIAQSAGPPLLGGVGAARAAMARMLSTAHGMAELAMEVNRQRMTALEHWLVVLEGAQADAGNATDVQALMAMPARLFNRHWSLMMQQFGDGFAACMNNELKLATRIGGESTDLMRQWTPHAKKPGQLDSDTDGQPLAQFSRMQDQWLATTQQWIDAVGGAAAH